MARLLRPRGNTRLQEAAEGTVYRPSTPFAELAIDSLFFNSTMKRAGVMLGFRVHQQEANFLQLRQYGSRFVPYHFQDFANIQRGCELLGQSKNVFKAFLVDSCADTERVAAACDLIRNELVGLGNSMSGLSPSSSKASLPHPQMGQIQEFGRSSNSNSSTDFVLRIVLGRIVNPAAGATFPLRHIRSPLNFCLTESANNQYTGSA